MRNWARLRGRLLAVSTATAAAVVTAVGPVAAPAQATPTTAVDGHQDGEQSAIIGTPALTPQDVKALAAKDAVAQADEATMRKVRAAAEAGRPVSQVSLAAGGDEATTLDLPCPDGDCSWRAAVAITQVAQQNSYYCGPAMLVSLVKVRSISISQNTAASRLGTTTDGTDWYNGRYPVQDALNHYLGPHGAYYAPVALPGSPTSTQKSQFRSRLMSNVNRNWGIAGDAWEVPGGPHLVGHPSNRTIFHWFAIRGYHDWGARTSYADSVSGASSISWSGSVPRYSTMNSDTIVTILGGRGYVW